MTEGKFVGNLIKTFSLLFVSVATFLVGSIVANELINSEDEAVIPFGFGIYGILSIFSIVCGYLVLKIWSQK